MQDHHRLLVYREAQNLARQVYVVPAALPASERYDLVRQLRRAAVSVGSCIAEGCGRSTASDFARFLDDSLGSANELEFQLDLCSTAQLAPGALVQEALDTTRRVQRMLTRLIIRIRGKR
jgi:four helix bundle protein